MMYFWAARSNFPSDINLTNIIGSNVYLDGLLLIIHIELNYLISLYTDSIQTNNYKEGKFQMLYSA
jgi:hypothetical protein